MQGLGVQHAELTVRVRASTAPVMSAEPRPVILLHCAIM
jgi:hypothetical protein